jgi:hypothetical protein
MSLWDKMKAVFTAGETFAPDARRLDGSNPSALASSLGGLPQGERGWITFGQARLLFSTKDAQYAFGDMDNDGKAKLAAFVAAPGHRARVDFMPVEGRIYFTRE